MDLHVGVPEVVRHPLRRPRRGRVHGQPREHYRGAHGRLTGVVGQTDRDAAPRRTRQGADDGRGQLSIREPEVVNSDLKRGHRVLDERGQPVRAGLRAGPPGRRGEYHVRNRR